MRPRKLDKSMAAALLILVRFFRENPGERWVHAEQHFKQHPQILRQSGATFRS